MSFGDAVLLREAEQYAVTSIVIWNTKDFTPRTTIPICTPAAYLQHHPLPEKYSVFPSRLEGVLGAKIIREFSPFDSWMRYAA